MVNLDIVKSMTDMCDGGAYIKYVVAVCGRILVRELGEVDRNHPMTTHHRGAEEARRAHNPKDG